MAIFKTDSRGFHTLTNSQSIPGVSQQKARYIVLHAMSVNGPCLFYTTGAVDAVCQVDSLL